MLDNHGHGRTEFKDKHLSNEDYKMRAQGNVLQAINKKEKQDLVEETKDGLEHNTTGFVITHKKGRGGFK